MKNQYLVTFLIYDLIILLLLPAFGHAEGDINPVPLKVRPLVEGLEAVDNAKEFHDQGKIGHAQDELDKLSQSLYGLSAKDSEPFINLIRDFTREYKECCTDDDLKGRARRLDLQELIQGQAKKLEDKATEQKERITREKLEEELTSRFRGFGFGIALGAVIDMGGRDRIESASLDSTQRVRVEADNNVRANFMVESHYFFTPGWTFPFGRKLGDRVTGWVDEGNWGMGPFICLQPGSSNIIEAVGIGWMFGFKKTAVLKVSESLPVGNSFNIGVGALIDIKQKVLGDGIRANEFLPTGETAIRLKETSQVGAVVIFSYSF